MQAVRGVLTVLIVPHNMANSESMVAILRSKHQVFSHTSCVFQIKIISQSIEAHFVITEKSLKGALYGIEPSTRNGKIWPTRERQHRQYLKISC